MKSFSIGAGHVHGHSFESGENLTYAPVFCMPALFFVRAGRLFLICPVFLHARLLGERLAPGEKN